MLRRSKNEKSTFKSIAIEIHAFLENETESSKVKSTENLLIYIKN